jgi:multidrug transporter EmrE-like cation transporter
MLNPENLERLRTIVSTNHVLPVIIIVINLLFNVVSNVCFKYSSTSPNWQSFLGWQVVGNLAGLATVLTLTWLLRFMPLHIAFPVTTGLTIIGVQIVAGRLLFGEMISPLKWFGSLLIVAGIVFVSGK